MLFAPAVPADLDGLLPLLHADPASSVTPGLYRERLARDQYREAHTWIARPAPGAPALAVAVWWAGPEEALPAVLDAVCVAPAVGEGPERVALAAALLTAGHAYFAGRGLDSAPEYHVFLPADWHARPEVAAALGWRREAARLAGLTVSVERLRYEWEASRGLPGPARRLRFHAEPDDEVFVDLFRRCLEGTLDAACAREAAELGAGEQARRDLAFYRDTMPGERSWWRVARDAAGEAVGFAVPSRNHECPVVGYLGVLPEYRGNGYADELLGEITRVLAEAGARRVRADTDLGNTPMAASFERTGYVSRSRRLVLSAA
ncbi:GNAT family N-acetyltransferase [Streptomyces sp. NPDC049954]|uniref:GNAT family N-acetyltransferase n=1 Tax=Streptomyces sp. NPDC049954 TaxID=3155779 RepID=UPI0034482905